MFNCTRLAFGLSAFVAASLFVAAPVFADDTMMKSDSMMSKKIDCGQAKTMLSNAEAMGTTTAYTGEIDRIILPTLMDREKGTNMMLHIEAQCGTDPKMKEMAAKAAADSDARMQMFAAMKQ
jgi:hypothetical protein